MLVVAVGLGGAGDDTEWWLVGTVGTPDTSPLHWYLLLSLYTTVHQSVQSHNNNLVYQ